MLKNLILSAAAAGVAAGLLMATLQAVTATPLILAAERPTWTALFARPGRSW